MPSFIHLDAYVLIYAIVTSDALTRSCEQFIWVSSGLDSRHPKQWKFVAVVSLGFVAICAGVLLLHRLIVIYCAAHLHIQPQDHYGHLPGANPQSHPDKTDRRLLHLKYGTLESSKKKLKSQCVVVTFIRVRRTD
ncbi:hypothetical protein BDN72DRAFT_653921 [Pluteus cervinus]|uniref:Uncharacterized protein n=1 Tax=Pluteus cervinus TaxID=181527 RepID=A0ACD3AT59_9AGAR|nr:hypothetical protein BDN72DRAFT_653921 [Pluteus cervinus]